MKTKKQIKLPDKYPLTDELLVDFRLLNADMAFDKDSDNTLVVEESAFNFYDYEFVEIKFPARIFPDSNFDELYEINDDQLNFEQPGNHSILLKMGIFDTIAIITATITASLVLWAKISKKGRVRSENGEYHLDKTRKPDEKGGVFMADVSYISYEKASEEEQKSWQGRAPIPPSLSIEIVSSKYGLKPALRKMQDVWMHYGTELGVVICPFAKKYFVFENDIPGYEEYSIYDVFTHALLPGYEGDFSEYADEI